MARAQPQFRSLTPEHRRERIVRAAKRVLVERGWEAASMDDVAARAGTTKPTVYAHFGCKEALFAAVADMVKGLLLGELQGPEVYADKPIEAVTLFCARYLELTCWDDAVALQRAALAAASQSLTMAKAVYEALYTEAYRSLSTYLQARHLVSNPDAHARLLLSATTSGVAIRYLFGVESACAGLPDPKAIGARVDMKRIRSTIKLIASTWKIEGL
jgi:AcrR family transcriptional regulator